MIAKTDHIVAVVAEPASGPGWSNTPLWVIVQDENGKLRRECLQPEEQSDEIRLLYGVAAQVHRVMCAAVEGVVREERATGRERSRRR